MSPASLLNSTSVRIAYIPQKTARARHRKLVMSCVKVVVLCVRTVAGCALQPSDGCRYTGARPGAQETDFPRGAFRLSRVVDSLDERILSAGGRGTSDVRTTRPGVLAQRSAAC